MPNPTSEPMKDEQQKDAKETDAMETDAREKDKQRGANHLRVEPDEADVRLDRWFSRHYPTVPHSVVRKLLRSGAIRVDDRRARADQRLQDGQEVRVPSLRIAPPANRTMARGWTDEDRDRMKSAILYEDEDLWVMNKPDGLAVQGGSGITRSMDAMMWGLAGERTQPKLVHRLDRQTSGALVIAKNAFAAAALARCFRHRDVVKIYWALSFGSPSPLHGICDVPLSVRPRLRGGERQVEAVTDTDNEEYQSCVTRYRTLARHQHYAWIALSPLSGRMHQLRVHCTAIGAPICGDRKYGGVCPEELEKRLYLHARSIDIPHPRGDWLKVQAPLPDHMKRAWRRFDFDLQQAKNP